MTRPTLALLIPAYNASGHLPRLLDSAARQTEPFDEIWVYDDGSSDDTAAVAERLGARVVRGEVNRGCTHGKSVLVQRTSCDWVHFHDADDLLLPDFASRARAWMCTSDTDVVVFGCEERWEDTGELISLSQPVDHQLAADAVAYTVAHKINAISGLYRRDRFLAAGGFDLDPDVLYNEDQACHCSLARAGLRFRGDPAPAVVNLRRRASMSTANQDKCARAHYHVMLKALAGPGGERHKGAIAERLWITAATSASLLDWATAEAAATLAMRLGGVPRASSGALFRGLCRLSPRLAIHAREWLIRSLRPRLRQDYPGWRAPVSLL